MKNEPFRNLRVDFPGRESGQCGGGEAGLRARGSEGEWVQSSQGGGEVGGEVTGIDRDAGQGGPWRSQ